MRFLATMLFLIPLCAQQPPEGAGKKRAPEPPKNLKILKPEEVRPAMQSFTAGLGVRCNACHMQGDFASDDNPKKVVARMMIGMVRDVNAKFADGKEHVTCYTCHRGAAEPLTAPPPAAPPAAPPAPPAE